MIVITTEIVNSQANIPMGCDISMLMCDALLLAMSLINSAKVKAHITVLRMETNFRIIISLCM